MDKIVAMPHLRLLTPKQVLSNRVEADSAVVKAYSDRKDGYRLGTLIAVTGTILALIPLFALRAATVRWATTLPISLLPLLGTVPCALQVAVLGGKSSDTVKSEVGRRLMGRYHWQEYNATFCSPFEAAKSLQPKPSHSTPGYESQIAEVIEAVQRVAQDLEGQLESKPEYVRIALTRALIEMAWIQEPGHAAPFAKARARVACFLAIAKQQTDGFNFELPAPDTPFDPVVQNTLPFAQIRCWPPGKWFPRD